MKVEEVWSETLESLRDDPQSEARDRAIQEIRASGEQHVEPGTLEALLVQWARLIVRLPDECLVGLTGQSLAGEIRILALHEGVIPHEDRKPETASFMKEALENAVSEWERAQFLEKFQEACGLMEWGDPWRFAVESLVEGFSAGGKPDGESALRKIAEVAASMWQHAV